MEFTNKHLEKNEGPLVDPPSSLNKSTAIPLLCISSATLFPHHQDMD